MRPWKPSVKLPGSKVSPGRFSVVFFTPSHSENWASHRESGEGRRTGWENPKIKVDKKSAYRKGKGRRGRKKIYKKVNPEDHN